MKDVQGVNGGYVLAKDIQAITVLELMELVTGPVEVAKCVGTSADCELIGRCNIQTPVNKMNFKFREFLSNLKLTDFLISASQKMGV